jgi:hypothetical protein
VIFGGGKVQVVDGVFTLPPDCSVSAVGELNVAGLYALDEAPAPSKGESVLFAQPKAETSSLSWKVAHRRFGHPSNVTLQRLVDANRIQSRATKNGNAWLAHKGKPAKLRSELLPSSNALRSLGKCGTWTPWAPCERKHLGDSGTFSLGRTTLRVIFAAILFALRISKLHVFEG